MLGCLPVPAGRRAEASGVSDMTRGSLTLASAMVTPIGTPRPSVSTERLTPRSPRSVRLGLVFPHRAAPCIGRRRGTTSSSRSRPGRRRPAGAPAGAPRTHWPAPTYGTGDEPRTRCRSRWRSGRSTGTRWAARIGSRPSPCDRGAADCAPKRMRRAPQQQRLHPRPWFVGQTTTVVKNRRLAQAGLASSL